MEAYLIQLHLCFGIGQSERLKVPEFRTSRNIRTYSPTQFITLRKEVNLLDTVFAFSEMPPSGAIWIRNAILYLTMHYVKSCFL